MTTASSQFGLDARTRQLLGSVFERHRPTSSMCERIPACNTPGFENISIASDDRCSSEGSPSRARSDRR